MKVSGVGFRVLSYVRMGLVQFIARQYNMEREVSEAVYDALMDTLNPTLWLTDQEIQIELNRIAKQSKSKITAKASEVVDFTPRQADFAGIGAISDVPSRMV
jgi:hypothetical protein